MTTAFSPDPDGNPTYSRSIKAWATRNRSYWPAILVLVLLIGCGDGWEVETRSWGGLAVLPAYWSSSGSGKVGSVGTMHP